MSEYEKVGAEVYPMKEVGDEIEGIYKAREEGIHGNGVYKIETTDGARTVFGTVILDDLMSGVEIGTQIKIVLKEFRENKKKGQNPIKVYEVFQKR